MLDVFPYPVTSLYSIFEKYIVSSNSVTLSNNKFIFSKYFYFSRNKISFITIVNAISPLQNLFYKNLIDILIPQPYNKTPNKRKIFSTQFIHRFFPKIVYNKNRNK